MHQLTRHKATPHWHISGSSRLRMDVPTHSFTPDAQTSLAETTRELGHKQYEISNHLGNVLSVITDQKLPVVDATVVVSYSAVVVTATDYSPFGVGLYGRSWSGEYRYGFQGQEEDGELWSGSVSYKYRVEDARLGRFFSVDPLFLEYSWNSSFAFSENRLVDGREREGLEWELIETENRSITAIQVTVNFDVASLPPGKSIEDYQAAISSQFNKTIFKSSNGWFHGIIKFDNNANESVVGRMVPSITILNEDAGCFGPYEIGAQTSYCYILTTFYKSDGSLVPAENLANDIIHELLHTLKVNHPFEEQNIADATLDYDSGENYLTRDTTAPNIHKNIMMYDFKTIDGISLNSREMNEVTLGQLQQMISEITKQMDGAGAGSLNEKYEYYEE